MKKTLNLDPFPAVLKAKTAAPRSKLLPEDAAGMTKLDGQLIEVVLRKADQDQMLEAAVHESVHVMQYVQEVIEGQLDAETQAYLTAKAASFIVKSCIGDMS